MPEARVAPTLLIAAHPDDETIGAGVRISQTPGIRIVHVTKGSPLDLSDARAAGFCTRNEYAAARANEAVRALALAGVPQNAITNLRFTDQQLAFELEELTLRILGLIHRVRPEKVFTHPYEGGHPDHDSVAFACHAARNLCELEDARAFELWEFTSYHAESGGIRTYKFLPHRGTQEDRHVLTPRERELKLNMLQEFKTQAKTLAPFLLPDVESFRRAPEYDFKRAPHAGRLFYEHFDWGVDGAAWRELAHDAEHNLLHLSSA